MEKKLNKRNHNIDFLRGVAALCIVVIHTAWWSGTAYLPSWFSNLTLLIDVPVFMFLSGMSFHYVQSIGKNLKSLFSQWKKWLYFLIFYCLLLLLFFRETFYASDIFSWIVYLFPHNNQLPVVGGSMWYMIMYVEVTIICSIIICTIRRYYKQVEEKCLKITIGILLLIFFYCASEVNSLPIRSTVPFYSIIYLLGYLLSQYKMKDWKQLLLFEGINFLLLLFTCFCFHYGIDDIQSVKFPPFVAYLPFSMISILLFWYLKDHLQLKKENWIHQVGKRAIYFYYARGISASLLYYIYPNIPFHNWFIVFICMLLCNLIGTTLGAFFLEKSYQYFQQIIKIDKWKKRISHYLKLEKI